MIPPKRNDSISYRRLATYLSMLVLTVTFSACATSEGSSESSDSNRISRTELTESSAYGNSAYEVVRSLRPQWLSKRAATAQDPEIAVYMDGTQMGNVQDLHDVSSEDLQEIRYLDGTSASMRFGTDHGYGAILLITRSGQ